MKFAFFWLCPFKCSISHLLKSDWSSDVQLSKKRNYLYGQGCGNRKRSGECHVTAGMSGNYLLHYYRLGEHFYATKSEWHWIFIFILTILEIGRWNWPWSRRQWNEVIGRCDDVGAVWRVPKSPLLSAALSIRHPLLQRRLQLHTWWESAELLLTHTHTHSPSLFDEPVVPGCVLSLALILNTLLDSLIHSHWYMNQHTTSTQEEFHCWQPVQRSGMSGRGINQLPGENMTF